MHTFVEDVSSNNFFNAPNFTITDSFFNNTYKNDRIYITILSQNKFLFDCSGNIENNINYDSSGNPFPLIITDLKTNIGNISYSSINFSPFFHQDIYTKYPNIEITDDFSYVKLPIDPDPANSSNINGLDVIRNVSTYKNIGYIDLSNNRNEYINVLELKLSTGNINGKLFYQYGDIVVPSIRQDLFFNDSFREYVLDSPSKNNIYFNNINNYPLIGRGLPFKILLNTTDLTELFPDYIGFKNCLPIMLGWYKQDNNSENRENTINFSFKSQYRFVHSNIDDILINNNLQQAGNISNDIDSVIQYNSPGKKLEIEIYNDKYYFKSIPFIFLKIIPSNNSNAIGNQLIKTNNLSHLIVMKKMLSII